MAQRKIIVLVLLILLSGCKVQRDTYCVYEKAPFKMDLFFTSLRNRVTHFRMITQVDLSLMNFSKEETKDYIETFLKENADFKEYIEVEVQQNILTITERYPLNDRDFLSKCADSQTLNYQEGYTFNRLLTIEEMHKLGFDCQ